MKKSGHNRFLSFIFLFIIGFFMIAVAVRFIGGNLLGISFDDGNAAEKPDASEEASYDWSKDYPFSGDYGFVFEKSTDKAEAPQNESFVKTIEKKVKAVESNIDYYTTNLLFGRMQFVEMNAAFNKLVGMNIISGTDSVVVMKNGYLTYEASEVDTDYASESLRYFYNSLKKKGIDFLYVQCPSKENMQDNQLPSGVQDNYNLNADKLLEGIGDIPYLDLRPALINEAENYDKCFFKTDHHWLPETGIWAAGKIADKLNLEYQYGINPEIGNLKNYNIKVYENYCLGSQGKKATLKYADPENISFIYPKADTDFTVQYDNDRKLRGRFEDTLLRKDVFDKIDYYNVSTYSAYLYGNHATADIRNNNVHNGKKILYIMDSFSASVIPYIALEAEQIKVLDIRYFNGSVQDFISKYSPDMVVTAYNPSSIGTDTGHNSTFNFE